MRNRWWVTVSYERPGYTDHIGMGNYRWRWLAKLAIMFYEMVDAYGKPMTICKTFILDTVPSARFVVRFPDEGFTEKENWECTKCESLKMWTFPKLRDWIFNPHWKMSKRPCKACLDDMQSERVGRPEEKVGITVTNEQALETYVTDTDIRAVLKDAWFPGEPPHGGNQQEATFVVGPTKPPKWVPPCDVCGGNCGQCAESHCAICGVKPRDGECDLVKHESYSYWKLGKFVTVGED